MHNFKFTSSANIDFPDNNKQTRAFIPGYGYQNIDIQTISNEALQEIFNSDYILKVNIPDKKDIIPLENQTNYFEEVKSQVVQRLQDTKFAIISGPTGTGKTTLARTIAYEGGLEFYEEVGDIDKSISDFLQDIKTYTKGNIAQVKNIPGTLLKALTSGGIYTINEANFLNNDVIIGLANLIENGFIIWNGKKKIIHPNFSIIFTSNEGYAGTKDYNSAVKRKAGGIISLEYEKESKEEFKILKSIYQRKKQDINSENEISDNDIETISTAVFSIRNELKKLTLEQSKSFYNEDGSSFSDYLYIRLYEKIIGDLLTTKKDHLSLKDLLKSNLAVFNKKVGGIILNGEYLQEIENDIEEYEKVLQKYTLQKIINIKENQKVDNKSVLFRDSLLNGIFSTDKTQEVQIDKTSEENPISKKITFNTSLYKQTLQRRLKSYGEELKRTETIEEISQNFYFAIIDTHREKDIKILGFHDNKLEILLNGQIIFLKGLDDENTEILSSFGKDTPMEDFKSAVFSNPNIQVIIEIDGDLQELPNILTNPRSFDIRRRSKILRLEDNGKKYVSLLGFRGNIKDIRYQGIESGNYYIPESKADEVIFSLYEETEEIPEEGHFFVLENNGSLTLKTKSSYTEGIILKRISKNNPIFETFEKEVKKRFANLDKLNLQNGGIEKQEISTPTPIVGVSYDVQLKVFDSIGRKLDIITKTTEEVLQDIIRSYISGSDVLLTGESGTGKTSISKEIANSLNLSYLSLQIPEDFSESDIKTKYEWNEGSVEETIQTFLNYYITGGVIELKEINMAFLSAFMNQYIDQKGSINYKGQVYHRHPNFLIIATRNPLNSVRYPGTRPLNLAFSARFKEIEVTDLPDEEKTQIIKYYLEKENKAFIANIGGEDILDDLINQTLLIVSSIKSKILELESTQDNETAEELKIYYGIDITVDKLRFLFVNSKNIKDFNKNLKSLLKLSDEHENILKNSNSSLYQKIINL